MSCAMLRSGQPAWRVSEHAWACRSPGDRSGDIDQVNAIAWALDPDYRHVDLAAEYERLRRDRDDEARPLELPRFIVGIGRKRIETAKIIRGWSRGQTKLVHIGRLRGRLSDLDYLVTTPAYPIGPSPKVLCLDIALSDKIRQLKDSRPGLALASNVAPERFTYGIRPDWINVFIGNPLRGETRDAAARLRVLAQQVNRLARQYDKDVVVSGGPRTHADLYDALASALACRHHLYRWAPEDKRNPFEIMIRHARRSIVTEDSVSTISQLVAAAHRVLIFPWREPRNPFAGILHKLLRPRGHRRKDVAAFRAALCDRHLAGELTGDADFEMVNPHPGIQDELFQKVTAFAQR